MSKAAPPTPAPPTPDDAPKGRPKARRAVSSDDAPQGRPKARRAFSSDNAPQGRPKARRDRSLKSRAIALLARREYGRTELKQRLLARVRRAEEAPAAEAEVDAVLDELAALGLLSEERYATAVITRKAGSYSRRAIAEALKAQGLGSATVTQALAEAVIDDDATMLALWQRRFGRAPQDEREKARQVRFLQSRGFSLSAILRLLRHAPS